MKYIDTPSVLHEMVTYGRKKFLIFLLWPWFGAMGWGSFVKMLPLFLVWYLVSFTANKCLRLYIYSWKGAWISSLLFFVVNFVFRKVWGGVVKSQHEFTLSKPYKGRAIVKWSCLLIYESTIPALSSPIT